MLVASLSFPYCFLILFSGCEKRERTGAEGEEG